MMEVVCFCRNISYEQVVECIEKESPADAAELMDLTNAGSSCGCCRAAVLKIFDELQGSREADCSEGC
jgi:bacterioferritin-associated ferredoxin